MEQQLQQHVQAMLAEGYCITSMRWEPHLLPQAQRKALQLAADGSFRMLPYEIRDSLLGPGSGRVADMGPPAQCKGASAAGGTLGTLDGTLTHLAAMISRHYVQLSGRSAGLLHEASPVTTSGTLELSEEQCCEWFGLFARNRIMVLLFLGPGDAQLELKAWEDSESDSESGSGSENEARWAKSVVQVLSPGDLVLIQAHLQPRLHAVQRCFSLSCFLQEQQPQLTPAAKVLQKWAEHRAATAAAEGPLQLLQDHLFCQGLGLSICSWQGRFPGSWQAEVWSSQVQGPDLVLQVPLARWDHEELYDPATDCWRSGKTFCRHAGFTDGIDLFDCKLFNISAVEAREMEPRQRMALEVAYDVMHRAGFRKSRLSSITGGIYVGAENWSEWNSLSTTSFSATGRAASILAGRISFVLGLKGPAVALDTGDCSGLTAVHFGAKALQEDGFQAVPEFCCCLGTSVLLSAQRWAARQAAGLLTAPGRCFTFDSEASGLVPGEATAALMLRREAEDSKVLLEALALQHLGRSASLTSGSSSAEQELLAEALAGAGIRPASLDLAECSGRSTLLDDAAEVLALRKVYAAQKEREGSPLQLAAVRPGHGALEHVPGLCALLRACWAAGHQTTLPVVHLRQLNP